MSEEQVTIVVDAFESSDPSDPAKQSEPTSSVEPTSQVEPSATKEPTEPSQKAEDQPDMGQCCGSVCGKKNKDDGPLPEKYHWEQNFLDTTIMKTGKISHAAILSFDDLELRAAAPASFRPDELCVKILKKTLKGDTKEIAEQGIKLGGKIPVCTPGKLDQGKAIYGSDGKGGGVNVYHTKECLLIMAYSSGPSAATRLFSEAAEHLEDHGR